MIALLAGILWLGGCATPAASVTSHNDSLVFDSPKMRTLGRQQFAAYDQLPWWADRNDQQLTTVYGYRGTHRAASHTRTYDRQSQYDGRVHNHYSQITIQREVTTVGR